MIETWIGILAAYLLDRYVPAPVGFRSLRWYHDWTESVVGGSEGAVRGGLWAVAAALAPICVGTLVLQLLLNAWVPWLGWAFGVLVLFLCLELQALAVGDGETADTADSLLERGARIVAVLAGYALFGAFGAVTLRLAQALAERRGAQPEDELGERATVLYGYLDWLPARLTALGYALAGRFQETAAAWRARPEPWAVDPELAVSCGRGALGCDGAPCEPAQASALVWRGLYVWMAILAVAAVTQLLY